MYLVKELFENHGSHLGLKLAAGKNGLERRIKVPEAQRPGLGLSGYLIGHAHHRILIFGKVEIEYLRHLDPQVRVERLEALLTDQVPAVIVSRGYSPPKELKALCQKINIPLFRTNISTMNLLSRLTLLLTEEFAPTRHCKGTLIEVFGVGVLIQGESKFGKNEAALGLIERGHRLVSDGVVKVKKREGGYLEGYCATIPRHHMEMRGIGMVDVSLLYGAVCVRNQKSIDLIVQIEVWQDAQFYGRVEIDDIFITLLGVKVPYHVLPVKPGRDVVLLLETIALNHRLRKMGYNSAQEFRDKVLELTSAKRRVGT